jgi:hypothetical protein
LSVAHEREACSPAGGRDAAAARWHLAHGAHLAACLALLAARGRQAVVQRDAGAVLDALIVCGLAPHWIAPVRAADPAAGLRVTPTALDAALRAAPGARAALVASGEPDVAALVESAHGHGAALVIDAADAEAAGAAVAGGADLVIAATPEAGGASPGRDAAAMDATSRFTRRRRERGGAALLHGPDAERWLPAAAIERAVTLAAGRAAAPLLPFPRAVVSARPVEAATRRFTRAVPRIEPGPTVCSPRAAWLAPQERVTPAEAVGRIAAEALTPAVPGVPAVLPGERLVPDVVATLRAIVDGGGTVDGAVDGLATIAVVAEPRR